MGFLGDIGGFLGGLVGGPAGAAVGKGIGEFGGSALGFGQSQDNRNREIEASDYQRALNAQSMAREDNAVQRRVADLKAAGLSPVLAAGSPASSASFRSGEAPKTSVMDNFAQASAMAAQKAQVDMTQAQVDQIKAQTRLINAQVPGAAANSRVSMHDAGIYDDSLLTTSKDSSTYSAVLRTIGSKRLLNKIRDISGLKYFIPKLN